MPWTRNRLLHLREFIDLSAQALWDARGRKLIIADFQLFEDMSILRDKVHLGKLGKNRPSSLGIVIHAKYAQALKY